MKRLRWIFPASLISGAALLLASVNTDYDHDVNFSKYRTYSWLRVKAQNDLWKDRIEEAVTSQLSAKGWNRVESGGDASVAAFGATREQHRTETFYDGLGGGWGFRRFGGGFGTATTTVDDIPIGTLTVHIFDSESKKLVWSGTSSDTLSDKPDKNEKKLEKATAEMFKKFPPNEKG